MDNILEFLKPEHRKQIDYKNMGDIEEFRLCVGQPLIVRKNSGELRLWPKCTQSDLEDLVAAACKQSVYAHTETLKRGFITIEGGHRIGVCGFGVLRGNDLHSIVSISSAVLRVAREVFGCADKLLPQISGSTLILGSPGNGKTTLLRDIIRQLSDKKYQRIGLADERGEISAAVHGMPQLQVGIRTDVLVNVPKSEAAMMLLRTMHPQWIAMDEVTAPADLDVMEHISYCGVFILATAHASGMEDLKRRPLYRRLMQMDIFKSIVQLKEDKSYQVLGVEN